MTEAKVAFDKVKDPFTKASDLEGARRQGRRLPRLPAPVRDPRGAHRIGVKQDAPAANTLVPVPAVENDENGNPKPIKPPQQSEKCKACWADIANRLKGVVGHRGRQVHRRGEAGGVHRPDRRAMLELGKMGTAASGAIPAAPAPNVRSDDRLVRQSILLTLPKVAGKNARTAVPARRRHQVRRRQGLAARS
jgi:hypothetical protein